MTQHGEHDAIPLLDARTKRCTLDVVQNTEGLYSM